MAVSVADSSLPVAERAHKRITKRLMPFLLLLYFLAYIDRTNVGVAALGMKLPVDKGGLGFDDAIIGIGAGIFFIGYFLLEIPGTLIVEKWSASKWIARIMISWGIVAALMGLVGTPYLNFLCAVDWCAIFRPVTSALGKLTSLMGVSPPQMTNCTCDVKQFYVLRFILGIAEAGFFPGIIVYLTHWFRYQDRAKAKSQFMIGLPVATIVGLPISRWIMEKVTWGGITGWRWVYILEGIPSVILGVVTIYYLTDWPHQAKWLPEDEKKWITEELERERREKESSGKTTLWQDIFQALKKKETILLAAIYLSIVIGYYGLAFFLPSIMAELKGRSSVEQTILNMLPYICALFAMLWVAKHSDQTGERRWHTVLPLLLGAVSMGLLIVYQDSLVLKIFFFCLVGIGVHAYLPVFWTWPSAFMTSAVAATSIGLINSVGNLGGYFGPQVVGQMQKDSGSYTPGLKFLGVCILVAGLLAMLLKLPKKPDPQSA
ncbi:MAG TPA: MFS transporter [Blastocatellia bacterium]|nr:MFS transporter [Blastocatellia bacterium]